MSSKRTPMLFLATAGMELSWLLAMAVLILSLTGVPPFLSLPQALAAFFTGAGLTLFSYKNNWRIVYRLGLHLFVLANLLFYSLYSVNYGGELFWSRRWLEALLQGPQDMEQGMLWAAALFITLMFWGCGILLARRSQAYFVTSSRFDIGITAFVLIFIIGGVSDAPVLPVMLLLLPFFLASMVAIALARNQKGDDQGAFQQKYRGNGPVLAFAAVVLLGGGVLVLFSLPFLIMAAEAGQTAMQQYGTPLLTLLGNVLLFIFRLAPRASRPVLEQGGSPQFQDAVVINGEESVWDRIFTLTIMFVLVAVMLLAAGWSLRQLMRWLLSGANKGAKRGGIKELLWVYLLKWRFFWQRILGWIAGCLSRMTVKRKQGDAAHIFGRLLAWGRWSGFDRLAAETPWEYGLVLGRHFPGVQAEIELIIQCFNHEFYGKMQLARGQKRGLWRAWRSLSSPRRWPARFYKRFTQGVNLEVREIDSIDLKSGIKEKGDKKADNGGDI